MRSEKPRHYRKLKEMHPGLVDAAEALGAAAHDSGPLVEKDIQLIQLAAAVALRSEGAVRSHARRAVQAGASMEEVRHAVIILTSTIGFPTVAAALDWLGKIDD
ncbi:MAG: carboxymuconolactone decarboxylase family protein [Deltaproteobacteria bacterium]|nr:carboxymuconolactone decarboxylase family protein [Deltaproteobacteria bacterium]